MEKPKYKEITINYEAGIHARPASQIAKIAKKANSAIYIQKNNQVADATGVPISSPFFARKAQK